MNLAPVDFVNSDWHDWRGSGRTEDRLLDETWRENFLKRWDLGEQRAPDDAILEQLKSLRALLRGIVRRISSSGPSEQEICQLNNYLQRVPLVRRVSSASGEVRLCLVPADTGWNWVMSSIAASFVSLLEAEPGRLKICANPDCSWVFYDESRNRTRRWCDDACGNLIKVRQFRARSKGKRTAT